MLFSAPMIRAILEGRKTQARRIVKDEVVDGATARGCPHGTIGDRLWVREAFRISVPKHSGDTGFVVYAADAPLNSTGPWKPSIYMPRWASRITLEITGVRVERLNDISEGDAKGEGVIIKTSAGIASKVCGGNPGPAQFEYYALWESINGKGSWNLNPWVWVLNFKRI